MAKQTFAAVQLPWIAGRDAIMAALGISESTYQKYKKLGQIPVISHAGADYLLIEDFETCLKYKSQSSSGVSDGPTGSGGKTN